MKKLLLALFVVLIACSTPKKCCGQFSYKGYDYNIVKMVKNQLKFSTVYGAVNGGTSISDVKQFSVMDGLQTSMIETPYDYSVTIGIRKIHRFGH